MNLFTVENKIRIVELKSIDVLKKTDNFNMAFELIRKHQVNYPNIEKWFRTKVIHGIKTNERAVYIGFNNNKPIASAVVKKGDNAKFCHLHIEEELRHQNIGDIFFLLMSIFIRRYATDVHFSLPESLWENKKRFFKSYGFENVKKYQTQYRSFDEELTASTNFKALWSKILERIPLLIDQFDTNPESPLNGIVMSIHPNYSNKILNGEKIFEIRRKFNIKWKNHKVAIYSSSPAKELVGYATIQNVIEGEPELVWNEYSDKLGCSKLEYNNYTKGLNKVYAISLSDVCKYHSPLSLNYLSDFFEKRINPPQSYSTVHGDKDWRTIISIAELLHGRFNILSNETNNQNLIKTATAKRNTVNSSIGMSEMVLCNI